MKLPFLFLLICCFLPKGFAQQDAWVYFTDKEQVEAALQNPISILSRQAIDRKMAQDIPIDVLDVPVNEFYIQQVKNRPGINVMAKSKWMNAIHVRGEVAAIQSLKLLDFVASVAFADKELNGVLRQVSKTDKFEVEAELVDFEYGSSYNQIAMIGVDALHLENYTGEGIVIAVIDAGFPKVKTMVALSRLRNANKLLGGYDFVNRTSAFDADASSSHGTRVLSTMAGFITNEFVGTAPDASYYLFRTEDAAIENPVEESYWVEAAERADSLGVHIINSSLGYADFDYAGYNYKPSDMDGTTTFISRGAQIASQKGMLVVNSAGNAGNTSWGIVMAPADASGVMTVGAVNGDGVYASFSSRGSATQPTQKPDVATQGAGTMVISENDVIVANNGTSFSAPILAGALACLWQALPNASTETIKQAVKLSTSQYTAPDDFLGYGIPNFQLALSLGLSVASPSHTKGFIAYPNPVTTYLNLETPQNTDVKRLQVYDVLGTKILEQTFAGTYIQLDVSGLSQGMYVLTIVSKHIAFNHKFIKS